MMISRSLNFFVHCLKLNPILESLKSVKTIFISGDLSFDRSRTTILYINFIGTLELPFSGQSVANNNKHILVVR